MDRWTSCAKALLGATLAWLACFVPLAAQAVTGTTMYTWPHSNASGVCVASTNVNAARLPPYPSAAAACAAFGVARHADNLSTDPTCSWDYAAGTSVLSPPDSLNCLQTYDQFSEFGGSWPPQVWSVTLQPLLTCPPNSTVSLSGTDCTCNAGYAPAAGGASCNPTQPPFDFPLGGGESCKDPAKAAGGPIIPATGEKYLVETDYQGTGPHALSLVRTYRSHRIVGPMRDAATSGLSAAWSHNHTVALSYVGPPETAGTVAKVKFGDGNERQFEWDVPTASWRAIHGSTDALVPGVPGLLYRRADDDSSWQFDAAGRLLTKTQRNGWVTTYTYSNAGTPANIAPAPGYLITVTNHFGRSLGFAYGAHGELLTVTAPEGRVVGYSFVGTAPDTRLASVSFDASQDGTWSQQATRAYHYESPLSAHLLTGITDELGVRYATYAYDDQGRGISTQHALGAQLHSIAYGTASAVVTDPLGRQRTYNYGTVNNQLVVTGASAPSASGANNAASRVQDANGFLTQETDFLGVNTLYTWDINRRLPLSVTRAEGRPEARTTSTQWHPSFRLPVLITEPARTIAYTYDGVGNKLSETVTDTTTGATRTWAWTYNAQGLVQSQAEPGGGLTQYGYDAFGQLTSITNPAGHVTTLAYNPQGQMIQATAPNGRVTHYSYDMRGQVKSQTAAGLHTEYTYRANRQLDTVALPSGRVISYTYDPAQRLTGWTDNRGASVVYTLDAMGNRTAEQLIDGEKPIWQLARTLNDLNRVTQETVGAGGVQLSETRSYDANGDLVGRTNGLSQSTNYGLDGLRRITAITNAAGATARLYYDSLDAVVGASDFKGAYTGYTRNGFGEAIREGSVDAGTRVTSFDARGLPSQLTDALNQTTTLERDALGRPTRLVFQDGRETLLAYDLPGADYNAPGSPNASVGYLSQVTDSSGTTRWQRDALGRVTRKVQTLASGASHATAYAFDSRGLLDTLTYPGGGVLQHVHDAQGRLARLAWNGQPLVEGITWNAAGQPTQWRWSAQPTRTVERLYDAAGRLTASEFGSWSYDAAGRITSLSQVVGQPADSNPASTSVSFATQTFTVAYDAAGRITSFADNLGNSAAFTYDANGNRTGSTETRGSTTIARIYTVDPQGNKLLGFTQQISGPAGTSSAAVNYTYNDNGDLTGDGLAQYSLNAEGRISSVTQGNTDTSPTTRYAHNALGQRVFKTEPLYENIPEQPGEQGFWASLMAFFSQLWSPAVVPAEQLGWAYVYDEAGTLLGEYGSGGPQSTGSTQHIWLPTAGGPLPIAAIVNGSVYAVHGDHLNTPRQLTNTQGQVAWQWKYSAFGDEQPTKAVNRFVDPVATPGTGSGAVADVAYNLRYPGQYADAESRLHYNYFRSYDARVGRYTQPDPIGLDGGWNRFGYVAQNPLRFTDPTGQFSREYMDLDANGAPMDYGGSGGGSGYAPVMASMGSMFPNPGDLAGQFHNQMTGKSPCTCTTPSGMSSSTAGNTIAGSMAAVGGAGAVAGGIAGTAIGVAEATHLGIVGGVAIGDAAATGAMAGGVLGAAVGTAVGVTIVVAANMCSAQPRCVCGKP